MKTEMSEHRERETEVGTKDGKLVGSIDGQRHRCGKNERAYKGLASVGNDCA